MSTANNLISLPLDIKVMQTKGPEPLFQVTLHDKVFKEIDFIGGNGKTISQALHEAAITMTNFEARTEEEKMNDFLTNKHNRKEATNLAFKFGNAMHWNTFTLDQLKKKKNKIHGQLISDEELIANLQNLIMFRNCTSRQVDEKTIEFKIVVKKDEMIEYMNDEAETHEKIIRQIRAQQKAMMEDLEVGKEIKGTLVIDEPNAGKGEAIQMPTKCTPFPEPVKRIDEAAAKKYERANTD